MVLISKNDVDTSSSSMDSDINFNERRIVELGKQLLKGRIFIGTLLEKYHVENLNAYRDVISIPNTEHQLIQVFKDLTDHITKFYPAEDWWIGITKPGTSGLPKTFCLWVEIPDGNPLGKYWFKIRNVKFRGKELVISTRIERKIDDEIPDTTSSNINDSTIDDNNDIFNFLDYFKETLEKSTQNVSESAWKFFSTVATPRNIKQAIVFISLLLVACVTGLFELLKFLCDFLIKFMYAWSHFVNVSLPLLQFTLNFFENIFKVFCTFLAYLIRPRPPQPVYQSSAPPRYIDYNRPQRSLGYSQGQGVIITEVN